MNSLFNEDHDGRDESRQSSKNNEGQFFANTFLISITSNYLWAPEFSKNQCYES